MQFRIYALIRAALDLLESSLAEVGLAHLIDQTLRKWRVEMPDTHGDRLADWLLNKTTSMRTELYVLDRMRSELGPIRPW